MPLILWSECELHCAQDEVHFREANETDSFYYQTTTKEYNLSPRSSLPYRIYSMLVYPLHMHRICLCKFTRTLVKTAKLITMPMQVSIDTNEQTTNLET